MIDVDFFDAAGHFEPHKVLFSPREDVQRTSSLWTRAFGGLMALHGKIWAKSYLTTHFRGSNESEALLRQIRETGMVGKSAFIDTVAECTLRYETLAQAARVKGGVLQQLFSPPSLKNLPRLVFDHIASIDWSNLKNDHYASVTAQMGHNICRFINVLEPVLQNDEFVNRLYSFQTLYRTWAMDQCEGENTPRFEGWSQEVFKAREKIANDIEQSIKSYREQRGLSAVPFPNPLPQKILAEGSRDSVSETGLASKAALICLLKGLQNSVRTGYKDFFEIMERCDLINYLEFGESAFSLNTDFSALEKLLSLKEDHLEILFKNKEQRAAFMKLLLQLKESLPDIRKRLKDASLKESELIEEGVFDQKNIDTDLLAEFDPSSFSNWPSLSEYDGRKVRDWVDALSVDSHTPEEKRLVTDIQSMSQRLTEWLGTKESARLNDHPHLYRMASELKYACSNFMTNLVRRHSADRLEKHSLDATNEFEKARLRLRHVDAAAREKLAENNS